MKNVLLLISITLLISKANAQEKQSITAVKLVEIADKADFSILVKLVSVLNYMVLDSSWDEKGVLFYFAKESKTNGNVLACSADTKNKITEFTFNTFISETNIDLKAQLKKLGFNSGGIIKKNSAGILESEDFEKDSLLIATATVENKQGKNFFEFTFIKW
ncbi:hypothetical protein CAP36_13255 [Chitinophagaceae bacterium IBVUCB2]|nr:hypothetical protein CAP36_13255 [Chitinophagaceae bacterium IBVUCB2]